MAEMSERKRACHVCKWNSISSLCVCVFFSLVIPFRFGALTPLRKMLAGVWRDNELRTRKRLV